MQSIGRHVVGCLLVALVAIVVGQSLLSRDAEAQSLGPPEQEDVHPRFVAGQVGSPITSLPFTIGGNGCGRYFLVSCLEGVSGSSGITVQASDVTIDLNGFSITGVPGSMSGIATGAGTENIRIVNGTIKKWDASGVDCSQSSIVQLEGLRLIDNGDSGVDSGRATSVRNCVSARNGNYGIRVLQGSLISETIVYQNDANNGINTDSGCVITSSVSYENLNGISTNSSTVAHCTVNANVGIGVSGVRLAIASCRVGENGAGGCTSDGLVHGSTVTGNGGFGAYSGFAPFLFHNNP